ncbi:histidine phosphatase family protein [Microbacterium sp. SORGH_AS_0888]|uniref:SixA phosphatase family protein n=1 Tax=Microbacterium sp. SORGH_AS_0888 TaxID=3041791 RepID=UPI00278B9F3D|nr:histidine phosphatase family protein [Microbacterium sp. SORGH_AS_0888]MDQ1128519.1 phosphohistidine phosphatase [Microbacterium sp. SORGH_AS_0888]
MSPEAPERTLVVLRHGKAAYPHGVADHDRPLADRGRREAARAGDWLRAHVPPVDLVLCSSAVRTRATLAATGIDARAEVLDELYGASAPDCIDLVRAHGGDARTVLVVGHEPSVSLTARLLAADRDGETALRMRDGFPTSGIAVLQVPTAWAHLAPRCAELVDFHVPR